MIPIINDIELEHILEAAKKAGANYAVIELNESLFKKPGKENAQLNLAF